MQVPWAAASSPGSSREGQRRKRWTSAFLSVAMRERVEAPAGFEPAVKLLQSSALPLGHGAGYALLVPRVRFELTRPKGHCPLKTACLPFHHLGTSAHRTDWPGPRTSREGWTGPKSTVIWQGWQDSNPRHSDLEADALPTELHPSALQIIANQGIRETVRRGSSTCPWRRRPDSEEPE